MGEHTVGVNEHPASTHLDPMGVTGRLLASPERSWDLGLYAAEVAQTIAAVTKRPIQTTETHS